MAIGRRKFLAGPGFEPGSGRPKRPMIVHYTIPPNSAREFDHLKPRFGGFQICIFGVGSKSFKLFLKTGVEVLNREFKFLFDE